jgi:hypothetical protein
MSAALISVIEGSKMENAVCRSTKLAVMAGLVPAIHAFACCEAVKAWMPGMKPGMTTLGAR